MKMNAVMFFILIVCFAQVANASDFKMIGGKEYKDATVKRVGTGRHCARHKMGDIEDILYRAP
jgi:hypothetical protein